MDLLERAIYFAIGAGFGFILGVVVARLRVIEKKVDDVKQEVHEVDTLMKGGRHAKQRDEGGFVRYPLVLDFALLFVVAITVFAAFSAARVNAQLDETVECLTQYNVGQAAGLEGRDKAIREEADQEIALWGLYGELYDEAKKNPEKIPKLQEELDAAIAQYRADLIKTQKVRDQYVYPDPQLVRNCKEQ